MLLTPGKQYPIAKENAALTVDESGAFYSIKRFNEAGNLLSTAFYAKSDNGPISKGVVVEGRPVLVN